MYLPLEIPPGVVSRGTEYEAKGRWILGHLMRWFAGVMRPVKGWTQRTSVAMTGKARAIIAWRDNSTVRWLAIGTHSKLYGQSQTGANPSDITPAGLTTGVADATVGGGYGIGLYGAGTYGTPRSDTGSVQPASVWTLDTFGEDLLACLSEDGRIFEWQRNIASPATALGGTAPTGNSGVVVTPERFPFALGAGGDKRKVQWADQESLTVWTPTATNQAGDFNIASYGSILCGRRLRGVTLIWTELDAHAATYIGLPFVYRFDRVGEGCGAISKNCVAIVDTRAFWMSRSGFFYSDGGIVTPIPCDVHELVFGAGSVGGSSINLTQASKVTAFTRTKYSEVWWLYPGSGSTEVDSYVYYNYVEGHWGAGQLERLSGIDAGIFNDPFMVGNDGYIYNHETGFLYTGESLPTAATAPLELGDGERIAKVRELIPDVQTQGAVVVSFSALNAPNADPPDASVTYGPFAVGPAANHGGFVNVHFAARQAQMVVTVTSGADFAWGNARLDVTLGGRR